METDWNKKDARVHKPTFTKEDAEQTVLKQFRANSSQTDNTASKLARHTIS